MADLLLYRRVDWYWLDRLRRGVGQSARWYSNAKLVSELQPGDRLWVVTSGAHLIQGAKQAGYLIGVWTVSAVIEDPGDVPAPPRDDARHRIVTDDPESIIFDDPVLVDEIVRPEGRDRSEPIGRFLSTPKRLDERLVRRLRAAAGPELALKWLTGNRR